MEHGNLVAQPVTEQPLPTERLCARERSLLRLFRALKPDDQAVVFKLMGGLAALTELEG
ncbi:hypothetical protein [Pseudomonas nitroreducens]|uniref:Uncharacterized protein n=1 Tax=Pseudomonas nitroreducens TaxID=46680 RepID=A0A6G6IVD5_PSENT|nr:hypothetical protein [Pseudomonas nitroreducens]QIE87019.1 hypothetical protein G5B91_12385 [Pseudomonas nitroreducens]